MLKITENLIQAGEQLQIEVTNNQYSMFNTGGVEIETGEFLYTLTRLQKPNFILETGTHLGISTSYFAAALRDNNKGIISTYEYSTCLFDQIQILIIRLNLSEYVIFNYENSLNAAIDKQIDMLFLDSEPCFRFDELLKFWEYVSPGGLIIIHDLHASLGHTEQTINDMYDWPFGDFREKFGKFIKQYDMQIINLNAPRGLTLIQKVSNEFGCNNYLKGLI